MNTFFPLITRLIRNIRHWMSRNPQPFVRIAEDLVPRDLPLPDTEPLHNYIRERVAAHAAAGSLDEAHGDLLDNLIESQCQSWSAELEHAYLTQCDTWGVLAGLDQETLELLSAELRLLEAELDFHQAQLAHIRDLTPGTTVDEP